MFSASVKVMENAAVEVAVGDALGNGKLNFKRVFNSGELAYTGAIKFDNPFAETGDGQYRFGLYHIDATAPRLRCQNPRCGCRTPPGC